MLTLSVQKREKAGKSMRALRRDGIVPGVVYGAHQEAVSISVPAKEFGKVFKQAGEATIVSLSGLGKEVLPTLIYEVDLDPLTSQPRHVDFYAVTKGQKVEVAIPLTFVGESLAVKSGANLIKVLHELEIEADPMNLPSEFAVDISTLEKIGDQIHVRDIKIPAGVELKVSADEVVALIQQVVEEKEEAPVAIDMDSIEVEKKGKEEAPAEAGAEAGKAADGEKKEKK